MGAPAGREEKTLALSPAHGAENKAPGHARDRF
jgi:hypothetical protein